MTRQWEPVTSTSDVVTENPDVAVTLYASAFRRADNNDGWLQEQDLKREEVYEVRKIIGKRLGDDDVVEYHVEWVPYTTGTGQHCYMGTGARATWKGPAMP